MSVYTQYVKQYGTFDRWLRINLPPPGHVFWGEILLHLAATMCIGCGCIVVGVR